MRNKTKYILTICLSIFPFVLTGCNASRIASLGHEKVEEKNNGSVPKDQSANVDNKSENLNNEIQKKQEELDMSAIQLSGTEERLLCEIYMDKEQIRSGELYAYQLEGLEQIRYGIKYLQEKYNREFYISNYSPVTRLQTSGKMLFLELEDDEFFYELKLTKKDNLYSAKDNYYGKLIREAYDQNLQNILNQYLKQETKVYTQFTSLMGEEVGLNMTTEQVIALEKKLSRSTRIVLEENSDNKNLAQKMEEIIRKNRLYGAYMVYFVKKADMEETAEKILKEINSQMINPVESISFQCFDL